MNSKNFNMKDTEKAFKNRHKMYKIVTVINFFNETKDGLLVLSSQTNIPLPDLFIYKNDIILSLNQINSHRHLTRIDRDYINNLLGSMYLLIPDVSQNKLMKVYDIEFKKFTKETGITPKLASKKLRCAVKHHDIAKLGKIPKYIQNQVSDDISHVDKLYIYKCVLVFIASKIPVRNYVMNGKKPSNA